MRIARCAAKFAATIATHVTIADAASKLTGSCGLMPWHWDSMPTAKSLEWQSACDSGETMNCEWWGRFHDGTICNIEGTVPGEIQVIIECEYWRERFAEPGDHFRIVLHGCQRMELINLTSGSRYADLSAIAEQTPEILSASLVDDAMEVLVSLDQWTPHKTDTGILKLSYQREEVYLDNGRKLSHSDPEWNWKPA